MAGGTRKNRSISRRKTGTRKVRMSTSVAKLSVPVKRAVNRLVHSGMERKYVCESPVTVAAGGPFPNDSLFNCVTNSSVMEMFTCVPRTVQAGAGTASSSQRIGQKLSPARMYSDFYITLNPAATQSKDIIVKLWILTSKEYKNYDDIANWGKAAIGAGPQLPINWLNDGQGGTTVSLGTLRDLTLPVENEQWTQLKAYTFRLAKSSQLLQNNGTSYVATSTPCYKRIRFYHKGPKQLTFDGNLNAQYPSNYAPVWCVSYAYADGTAPQVGNKEVFVMNNNHLEFYDA